MPEGPEVTLTAQYLKRQVLGKTISKVKVLGGRYIHQKLTGFNLTEKEKLEIVDVNNKGKFFWFELLNSSGETVYLLNTFGMTGRWVFEKSKSSRLRFKLDDCNLYYNDQRNFGTICFTKDKKVLTAKLEKLALDLVKSEYSKDEMYKHVKKFISKKKKSRSNKNIVYCLMTQDEGKGIGSGIGNYLCAEILYQAKLSPHNLITQLTKTQMKNLAEAIRVVMKNAYVNNSTNYLEHIRPFVDNHYEGIRDGIFPDYYPDIKSKNTPFTFKVYGQEQDPLGNPVIGEVIFQKRKTWWVKAIQE